MMQWLTEDASLACDHGGGVRNNPRYQSLVRIDGKRVLVATDPEGCSIRGCPNANIFMGMKPCTVTLTVKEGYSTFVGINGHRVCLASLRGLTDGMPSGTVDYKVLKTGQQLVEAGG